MRITRKLLIPALIFITLIIVGLITYNTVVSVQKSNQVEYERLEDMGEVFQARLKSKEDLAVALASEVANNPEVQIAFAARDRERLIELTLPSYQVLDAQFDVPQYQFHLPPATSFLRLHSLDKYGDDLSSFRFTVLAANAEKRTVSGPELGRGGLGVRGVVPVTYQGNHIGTVEFGTDIGSTLIEELKGDFGYDMQILLSRVPAEVATFEGATGESQGPTAELLLQASTLNTPVFAPAINYDQALAGSASFEQISVDDLEYVVYSLPLYDYSGNIIGVVDIISDYTVIAQQQRTQIILSVGILLSVLLISGFGFAYLAGRTLRPIGDLTSIASAIAAGDFSRKTNVKSDDELGILAQAFDSMTVQLQDLFGTLEQRVADRTRNLELAAEVGRAVSQVRALDIMLQDACELILKEFNLYYVQVYLTDPGQTTLRLEAGTGTAGRQLLERSHSLSLNTGSINGRAAVEKGSVVIPDTTRSATFRQNPLLPDTRGEMAVPLIVGDKVVGVLDMQSSDPGVLTQEVLPAFEALAGQLAVAIQNANLLVETEQARAEVEAQARRLVRQGWNEHLDAIHMPEKLGFIFEHNKVAPLAEADAARLPENSKVLSAPIAVTGESLGSLVVEINDESGREQTSELVNAVAHQVARQIENLRLLSSAERFRLEAEEATRRLTREGWKSYVDQANESLSFVYDLKEVRPQNSNGDQVVEATGYTLPLRVRDETIGKLVIQGMGPGDGESLGLANTIAERLSTHIEGLRLTEQTQKRAYELEAVAAVSTTASSTLDPAQLLQSVVNLTRERFGLYHAHIYLLNDAGNTLELAAGAGEVGKQMVAEGWKIPLDHPESIVARVARNQQPVIANNIIRDTGSQFLSNRLLPNTRSEMAVPLIIGDKVLGVFDVQADTAGRFTEDDVRIQSTLAAQVSSAVQNARSFTQAQKQAERESKLNVISQKIQSATTVEAVLQIAARELGHTLGAAITIAQLGLKENQNGN